MKGKGIYFDKNKEEQNGICECEIPCVSLGKKSKCVIKIVPEDEKTKTFEMDKKCIKIK